MPLLPHRLRLVSKSRLLIGLLATAAVLLAFGLFPSDARAADAPTETLELHPGDNFVGWVAEPIAVADIFEQISAATLIYTWNADSRTYRHAIRDVGGTLERLDPGMSARIRIEGRKTVKWERPLTPAKGMVTLYSGVNWVAWNGRDEWPLDQVARGIGTSLVSIEVEERGIVYEPGSDISGAIEPLSGKSTLRRGDALRVTVNRDLRWLQPTGMMPNIAWAGDPSQALRDKITTDIRRIVDFFAKEFAVETDFSETTLVIHEGIDAVIRYVESGQEPKLDISPGWVLENVAPYGAPAFPWGTFVPSCAWQPPCPGLEHGIQLLTHEMFHILQYHLTGSLELHATPAWMDEGTAMWAEWRVPSEFHAPSVNSFQTNLNWLHEDAARTSVTLPAIEAHSHNWAYRLGHLASLQLAKFSSVDSIPEFYRLMLPQAVGEGRRWLEQTQWKTAFETAFGLNTTEFYEQFSQWRATLPEPRVRYDYDQEDVTLAGTLHYKNGSPATGFRLNASNPPGEPRTGIERRVIVDEEGAFSIDLAPNTIQRIWFERAGCTLHLTTDGLTATQGVPLEYRDLDTRKLPDLHLTLPLGVCTNELRVDVLELRNDQRRVSVYLTDAESYEQVRAHSGQVAGVLYRYAPEPGAYRARVRIGGCELSYTKEGLVPSWRVGDVLELSDQPVSLDFRIPHDLCVRRISGRIVQEDGTGVGGVWLNVSEGDMYSSEQVSAYGTFDMAVPDAGDYMLSFGTDVAGCRIRYSESGATTDWHRATPITVADADVTGIEFVVPDDPASLCE